MNLMLEKQQHTKAKTHTPEGELKKTKLTRKLFLFLMLKQFYIYSVVE